MGEKDYFYVATTAYILIFLLLVLLKNIYKKDIDVLDIVIWPFIGFVYSASFIFKVVYGLVNWQYMKDWLSGEGETQSITVERLRNSARLLSGTRYKSANHDLLSICEIKHLMLDKANEIESYSRENKVEWGTKND